MNLEKLSRLDEILKEAVGQGMIAGGNGIVWHKGEEAHYFQTGYANIERKEPIRRDSIFRLFSMSKPITSVAVMLLIEQGRIEVEDPVSMYLAGFSNTQFEKEVRIRHLLSMTAGLCYPSEEPNANHTEQQTKLLWDRLIDGIKGDSPYANYGTVEAMNDLGMIPLAFEPGSSWNYSACADVLGAIVEVVSGQKLSQFMQENIFEPLEMKDTGFYVSEEKQSRLTSMYEDTQEGLKYFTEDYLAINHAADHPPVFESGGAGLLSTIDDYSNFAEMLMNQGNYKGKQILSPKTVAFMTGGKLTPQQQKAMGDWNCLTGYSYSNLLRVLRYPEYCGHLNTPGEYGWDGWLGCFFMNAPEDELTFILMIQRAYSGTIPMTRRMVNTIYRAL